MSAIDTDTLDLASLFKKYGSDKDVNGYSQPYYTMFDHLKDKEINFLEIGIGTMIPGVHSSMVGYSRPGYKPGGSLRAWRDFFINGRIIGLDVQPDTQFSDEDRIETYLCDTTNESAVKSWYEKKMNDVKFDIIIDDGSHIDTNQISTLHNLYKYLNDGGIYVIEDIYPGSNVSQYPDLVKQNCNDDPFFFVGIKNNLCFIYKKHINSNRANY